MAFQNQTITSLPVESAEEITRLRFAVIKNTSGSATVEQNSTAGGDCEYVALEDSDNGDTRAISLMQIGAGGVAEMEAGGAVTIGSQVASDNQGRPVAAAASAGGTQVLGKAREAAAAAGDIIEIELGKSGILTT